jgi:integrase
VVGKGGHERLIPVPDVVAAALDAYLATTPGGAGPLIRSAVNPAAGLAPHTIGMLVTGWIRHAGVKRHARDRVGAHSLRHTCASDVHYASLDLAVVKEVLGHANIATTSRYLRRDRIDDMRTAMEAARHVTEAAT